jgi:2-polyprenyl-3-methyl-5-hydroxy-6-metoxy-1,4-benzoquinol methylase
LTNLPSQEDIHHGQSVYTKTSLKIYDLYVTELSNRFAWHCPPQVLIDFFEEHISANHLDIGVGTGYFLRKLTHHKFRRLGLMDLNEDCLAYAKNHLKKYNPETYKQDVFRKFTDVTNKFDSVSLNYVLHCLPGTLAQKAIVFDHIKEVLNPGGQLFGSTILGKGTRKNWLANRLLSIYNNKKIMNNLNDDDETLKLELEKRYSNVEIHIKGCVALFSGRR